MEPKVKYYSGVPSANGSDTYPDLQPAPKRANPAAAFVMTVALALMLVAIWRKR